MATKPTTDTVQDKPTRKVKPLGPAACKLRESTNNTWRAVIPRGTPREDLLSSDFWSVMSRHFLPYDLIHAVDEGRGYFMLLLVLDAGHGYANVTELLTRELPPLVIANNDVPPNHEIVHLGPDELYGVRRLSDGVLMGKGFPSRQEALTFLLEHATLQ